MGSVDTSNPSGSPSQAAERRGGGEERHGRLRLRGSEAL